MTKKYHSSQYWLWLMRFSLTQFVLTLTLLGVTYARDLRAQDYLNRRISLNIDNKEIKKVLLTLERTADVRFMYSSNVLPKDQKISIQATDEPLGQVLERVFRPMKIKFELMGKRILLSPATTSTLVDLVPHQVANQAALPARTIQGRVVSETGEGLPGVSVIVRATSTGTVTDAKGDYSMEIPNDAKVLIFSFVGYLKQEVAVGNQTTLNVQLQPNTQNLDEVVVVGYGTQNRRDITGSIGSIKTSQITDQRVTSLDQALQGQIAGVQVQQTSGAPGGNVSIKIRGVTSIGTGSDPLFVVDGFPINNDKSLAGLPGSNPPNPLSAINPADILSIEVLKDASSTAIYGSRGANGVILITTKQGDSGKSRITLDVSAGMQSPSRTVQLMDAGDYAQAFIESRNNRFLVRGGDPATPNALRGANRVPQYFFNTDSLRAHSTNWVNEVIRPTAIQNYQLSATGGSANLKYAISGSYLDQGGIIIGTGFKRYTLRSNIEAKLNTRTKLGVNFAPSYSFNKIGKVEGHFAQGSSLTQAFVSTPILPVYDADGSYSSQRSYVSPEGLTAVFNAQDNAVAMAQEAKYEQGIARLLSNMYVEYEISPSLKFKTTLGVDASFMRLYNFRGASLITNGALQGGASTSQSLNWLNENTLSYAGKWGQHALQGVAGFSAQKNSFEFNDVSGINLNPEVPYVRSGRIANGNQTIEEWALVSYLGRLNYQFKDRYLATVSFRSDGSSRFGNNNRYGYFPSAALGWRMADEPFMKKALSFVSDWKWRVSYGLTGNNNIGNYSSLGLTLPANYVLGGSQVSGYAVSTLDNPDLTWEKNSQFDVGADISLFNNRLNLTADYYYNKTIDLLWRVNLPALTGISVPGGSGYAQASTLKNIGQVENKGFEFAINSQNLVGAFNWTTNFNISFNRNKVLSLGVVGERFFTGSNIVNSFQVTEVGRPTAQFYTLVTDGIFQNQEEVNAYQRNGVLIQPTARPGDFRYRDVNDDGRISPDDRDYTGNPHPQFSFGFSNNFSYKNFSLNVLLSGVYGNKVMNVGSRWVSNLNGNLNGFKEAFEGRWISPDQPGTGYPSVSTTRANEIHSFNIEDGSFVRVRNVTLAYALPKTVFSAIGLQGGRVYFSGQNLLTLTRYSGLDPEVNENGSNPLSLGVDAFGYPSPRVLTLGLTANF